MPYEIVVSDEFRDWYEPLSQAEQASIEHFVELLLEAGPSLPFPYCSGVGGSAYGHMRELRVQHAGRPYRILYAFDPARSAYLIIGGDKTGDARWYDRMVPIADAIYAEHLREMKSGNQTNLRDNP